MPVEDLCGSITFLICGFDIKNLNTVSLYADIGGRRSQYLLSPPPSLLPLLPPSLAFLSTMPTPQQEPQ